MKFKKNKVIYILIILILLIIQSIYYRYIWSNKLSAYKVQRTTEDLALTFEGLTFVCMNNGVYIQPNWIFRTSPNNHSKIENIEFTADIDKRQVIRMYLGELDDSFSEYFPQFVGNVNLNDDSILKKCSQILTQTLFYMDVIIEGL